MIDIETIGVAPAATILTIAAQAFDPFGNGHYPQQYYARISLESQEDRTIDQGTVDWWATQPAAARDEAFNEQGRIPLDQALDELGKLIWNSKFLWCQGPTFDCTILEHAYKSLSKSIPWPMALPLAHPWPWPLPNHLTPPTPRRRIHFGAFRIFYGPGGGSEKSANMIT